jgi:alkyl sulfatase BDS1-like metallo-beta-lactamase superfamily hydrolase
MLGPAMKGLPAENQLMMLTVRLKAEETLAEDMTVAVRYSDTKEDFGLHLRRGVLEVSRKTPSAPAFRIETTREAFGGVLGGGSFDAAISNGGIKVAEDKPRAKKFFSWFVVPFTRKPEVVVR